MNKRRFPRNFLLIRLLLDTVEAFSGAENERDTPNACECNDGLDHAADQRTLTAKEPCYDVKLKQSNATPIQRTDDGEDQGDSIHNHNLDLL